MKRILILCAAMGLSACQPPADDTPGVFEPFNASRVTDTGCTFFADGETSGDQYMFATRQGDPDHIAYVQFKGELLKLVPPDVPSFGGEALDITYDVLDYLNWKVRLQADRSNSGSRPALYTGQITLVDTDATAAITGFCGR